MFHELELKCRAAYLSPSCGEVEHISNKKPMVSVRRGAAPGNLNERSTLHQVEKLMQVIN